MNRVFYRLGTSFRKAFSVATILAYLLSAVSPALSVNTVQAAGGDFANTDFTASGPYSYDHANGGGAYDDGSNSKATGVVESLEGSDFACGDTVTFLTAIKISANPVDANQTAEFSYKFLADSTGQSGAAITDIINVMVNRGPVAYGAGPGGTDAGLIDDGGSVATLISETLTGPVFTSGSEVLGTVRVTDLEANEQVIVRIDVRLSCKAGTSPTGNLQGQLASGAVVSPVNDVINTGQQTIPFLQIGNIAGAGEPLISVIKTVTTAAGTCPGSETLTATAGDAVKYCYFVRNPGTAPLYNVKLVDDNGTPANPADDFVVALTGLASGGLPSNMSASGSALVTLNAAGSVTNIATATGDNNATGQKQVFYTDTDSATVVVMGPPNSAPVANNDSATVAEDASVTIPATGNDTDPDNNLVPSSAVVVNAPTYGTVVNNGDGTFTYTPNANFNGIDSFEYKVCDALGLCDTATVNITVAPVNDAPVAVDDEASTLEDTPVQVTVLANDSDVDGNPLSISANTQPSHGSVTQNADGTFTYIPNPGYFGPDSFTYTITDGQGGSDTATVFLTVKPVNDAPFANNDSANTDEDTPVTIHIAANDTDPENNLDVSSVTVVSDPTNGTLVINGNGNVTYTPNLNFSGIDSFIYQICDMDGLCDTATVTVVVNAVNDAPVANDDAATTPEETPVTFPVLENDFDADGDKLTVESFTSPANGTLVQNEDGTFTYTPNTNFNGTDSFTYTITDGKGGSDTATVILTVDPVNDMPVAVDDAYTTAEDTVLTVSAPGVLGNDSDLDGDTLSINAYTQPANGSVVANPDGSFNYTPNANYNGPDRFTYTASDNNGGLVTATVNITVTPVNDVPVANDDAATTMEDIAVAIAVLANDFDPDGDPLSIDSVTQPANGSVFLSGNGTFTYTPNSNWSGTDTFTYTVCDPSGFCRTANVTVVVLPVNDPPVANDDTTAVSEDGSVSINVAGNDTDVDGNLVPASVVVVLDPSNGTLVNNGDGTFTYTPNPDFNGEDTFTYEICDEQNECDTATVTVTVTPANDAPVANEDSLNATEDTALVINPADLLGNDSDIDGDTLTITNVSSPSNGTLTPNGDGSYTYTPNANFCGTDTFTYTISDGQGGTATAPVSIVVACVNDAPTAVDNRYTTAEDTVLVVPAPGVLGNDSDSDGDTLVVNAYNQPTNGQVVLNPDGSFTYTPNADFNGADSFTYTVTDGNGGYATATVYLTVTPVNDAPVAMDDTFTATEDAPLSITPANLLENDTDVDGDTLSITAFTQPVNGTLVQNGNGTFTYTPNANFNGEDTFTYTISDGKGGSDTATVTITVSPVNDAPVAKDDTFTATEDSPLAINPATLLGNDTDVDGDPLSIDSVTQPANGTLVFENGVYTYTPNANFCGTDTFTYTISDGQGGYDTATATIQVACVNDAPLAINDAYSTTQNVKLTVQAPGVLVNDSDPVEGSPITVSSYDAVGAFGGTIVMNPNGSFTYMPAKDFAGYDTFTYTITDGQGGYATATVTITVAAKNGRSIAVSWGDWTRSGDLFSGFFNIQNMSGGGYAVQLTSFAVQVQYKTSSGNAWTDVAVSGCAFNPAAPTMLQTTKTIQFSGCQVGEAIPAGATIRVTALVGIYGHKDQGQVKQLFLSRLSK